MTMQEAYPIEQCRKDADWLRDFLQDKTTSYFIDGICPSLRKGHVGVKYAVFLEGFDGPGKESYRPRLRKIIKRMRAHLVATIRRGRPVE